MPRKKLPPVTPTEPSPSSPQAEVAVRVPPTPLPEPFIAPADEPDEALAVCPSCGKAISPGSCYCAADGALPTSIQKRRERMAREFLGSLASKPFVCQNCREPSDPEWKPLRGSLRIRAEADCPHCGQHHTTALEAKGLAEVQRSIAAIYVVRRNEVGDLVQEDIFARRHIARLSFCPYEDRDHLAIQETGGEVSSFEVKDASLAVMSFERSEHGRAMNEAQAFGGGARP
jgi:hypothetical protein